ncbi:MAG: DUF6246 family protein [Plesiomonas sp.]
MGPILSIGQQAIIYAGESYTFTPSFRHIAAVGEPEQIVDYYNYLTSDNADTVALCSMAHDVMTACSDRKLPKGLLWETASSWDGSRVVMVKGKVDLSAQILMAVDLLYMGVIGRQFKLKEQGEKRALIEFDASSFVSSAVVHLGMQPEQAWSLTITEFNTFIRDKYPDLYHPDLPSADEIERLFSSTDSLL